MTVDPADVVRAMEKMFDPGSKAGKSPTVCAGSFADGITSFGFAISAQVSTADSARNSGIVTVPATGPPLRRVSWSCIVWLDTS